VPSAVVTVTGVATEVERGVVVSSEAAVGGQIIIMTISGLKPHSQFCVYTCTRNHSLWVVEGVIATHRTPINPHGNAGFPTATTPKHTWQLHFLGKILCVLV
jgi:hypothetical protein